ncbi:hypothetical protein BGX24_005819 [Mortierella sp. AD032]|nr:hypothetical protein BGX24_005819 [Mortierella sp. AD032]
MPPHISVELSPVSETISVSALTSPTSSATRPTPVTNSKASMVRPSISTSPPGGGMDNATMGRPHASPSSTASSFSSASPSSSPSSSTFSLPATALSMSSKGKGRVSRDDGNDVVFENNNDDDEGGEEGRVHRDRALADISTGSPTNHNSALSSRTAQSSDVLLPTNNNHSINNFDLDAPPSYEQQPQQQQQQHQQIQEQEPLSSNGKRVVYNHIHNHNNQSHDSDESDSENNPEQASKGKSSNSSSSGKGKNTDDSSNFDQERPRTLSSHGRYATDSGVTSEKSTFYTTTTPSLSSLSSVEEEDEEDFPKSTVIPNGTSSSPPSGKARPATVPTKSGRATSGYASGSEVGSSSSSSPPRAASAFTNSYSVGGGSGSGSGAGSASSSGSGSGSGSNSKPILQRASTGPATFLTSSSSAAPPVPALPTPMAPVKDLQEYQDLSQFSYDNIPDDFDFGDVPFYDTDPRTGTIYGDPHAYTRPHLVPEVHYDLYRFTHDEKDPRRTNVFNKHGALLYYHPGRHIGQEQDSLRMHHSNNPIWVFSGRTSTWGTLTATDMASRRQIKIVQELVHTKKKDATTNDPLTRFLFRWKEDDFVVEYRKHKDQYRITTSQMCGGESKWRPPQLRPAQTMFHGMGMEVGNPIVPSTLGSPSPFDADRYLQLISEYRLNSGPVLKRGDFELHNPDTFPLEFRTFLMTISIVALDVMRPVNDKQYYAMHPEQATKKPKVTSTGGLHATKISGAKQQVVHATFKSTLDTGSGGASSVSLHNSGDGSGRNSTSSRDAPTPPLVLSSAPATPTVTRRSTAPASAAVVALVKPVSAPAPVKKSKWSSFFKK